MPEPAGGSPHAYVPPRQETRRRPARPHRDAHRGPARGDLPVRRRRRARRPWSVPCRPGHRGDGGPLAGTSPTSPSLPAARPAPLRPRPARAYTCGSHVVIGDGYADKHTLAQELALATRPAQVQAKLAIGEPGDKYEQEADQVAAELVRQMNAPPVSGPPQTAHRQTSDDRVSCERNPWRSPWRTAEWPRRLSWRSQSGRHGGRRAAAGRHYPGINGRGVWG